MPFIPAGGMAMTGKIFVNYRREDSAPHALSIAQYLEREFGSSNVFLDIDRLRPGQKFPEVLEQRLSATRAMLVVIGPSWLTIKNDTGERRIDDLKDWVRLEIARALATKITVIPVLVGGASLPRITDLPDDLKPLAQHQLATITTNGFRTEMSGLVRDLREVVGPSRQWRWPLLAAGAASLALASIVAWHLDLLRLSIMPSRPLPELAEGYCAPGFYKGYHKLHADFDDDGRDETILVGAQMAFVHPPGFAGGNDCFNRKTSKLGDAPDTYKGFAVSLTEKTGDDFLDLMLAKGDEAWVHAGRKDGTFAEGSAGRVSVADLGATQEKQKAESTVPAAAEPKEPAPGCEPGAYDGAHVRQADFNGDGQYETIFVDGQNAYTHEPANGGGFDCTKRKVSRLADAQGGYDGFEPFLLDRNGDGTPDLVLTKIDEAWVHAGRKDGTFAEGTAGRVSVADLSAPKVEQESATTKPAAAEVRMVAPGCEPGAYDGAHKRQADFDGDGQHETIFVDDQNAYTHRATKDGGFDCTERAVSQLVDEEGGYAGFEPSLVDQNGDGIPDIVLSKGSEAWVHAGKRDGTFAGGEAARESQSALQNRVRNKTEREQLEGKLSEAAKKMDCETFKALEKQARGKSGVTCGQKQGSSAEQERLRVQILEAIREIDCEAFKAFEKKASPKLSEESAKTVADASAARCDLDVRLADSLQACINESELQGRFCGAQNCIAEARASMPGTTFKSKHEAEVQKRDRICRQHGMMQSCFNGNPCDSYCSAQLRQSATSSPLIGHIETREKAATAACQVKREAERIEEEKKTKEAEAAQTVRLEEERQRKEREAEARASSTFRLTICNRSTKGAIFVAMGYFDYDASDWVVEGWWEIAQDECAPMGDRFRKGDIYFYANTKKESWVWAGDFGLCVQWNAFRRINKSGVTCPSSRFRKFIEKSINDSEYEQTFVD